MKTAIIILALTISTLAFGAKSVDEQCQITGCSGQICRNEPLKDDDELATTCEYKNYYECYKITNCVVKKGANSCDWEQSPKFLSCLKEKKAPRHVIQRYTGHNVIRLIISAK